MADKKSIGLEFYNQFLKLTESEREKFSKYANKLLEKSFLIRQRDADREGYYFVLLKLTLFQTYFQLMDFTVTNHEADQIISLATDADRNRLWLKRTDTIILLILRQLYQQKAREATLSNQIMVSVLEINDAVDNTRLIKGKLLKTELQNTMRLLRNYSIIDYISADLFNDDTKILLYPSLLHIVNINDMNRLEEHLKKFKRGGDDDENDDQD